MSVMTPYEPFGRAGAVRLSPLVDPGVPEDPEDPDVLANPDVVEGRDVPEDGGRTC